MRARSAMAGLPQAGTRRDRLARALSEDWEPTVVLSAEIAVRPPYYANQALLEFENVQIAARRAVVVNGNGAYRYEWRRGPLWESAYGGEG